MEPVSVELINEGACVRRAASLVLCELFESPVPKEPVNASNTLFDTHVIASRFLAKQSLFRSFCVAHSKM